MFGNETGAAAQEDLPPERRRLLAPTDRLCGITDVGQGRDHNEDTFAIAADGRLLIVADGMGGHAAGEVASALAVQIVTEFLTPERLSAIDSDPASAAAVLAEASQAAQAGVLEAAAGHAERNGMGTTVLAAYVAGDMLYTCHVGDVRGYVRSSAGLEQITRDHSTVGVLVRSGQITREEARVHPKKNEILQAIGLPAGIIPEINASKLSSGDRVLLCSDGLWEALSDEEISTVVDSEGSMRQRAIQLVDRANGAGGFDNITVVLYEHGGETLLDSAEGCPLMFHANGLCSS